MDHILGLLTRRELVAGIAGGIAFVVGLVIDGMFSNGTHAGASLLAGLGVAALVWLACLARRTGSEATPK